MSKASCQAALADLQAASDKLGTEIAALPSDGGPFTDLFDRANQNLENPNWTRSGGAAGDAKIESNVVKSFTTDLLGAAYLAPDTGVASQYVSGIFQSNTSLSFLCVRLTDPGNWIGFRWYNGVIEIYKRIGGANQVAIGTAFTTARGTSVFRLEYDAIAATVRVLKDGTPLFAPRAIGTITGLPASTRAGLVVRGAALPFIDNFSCGPL